jgi:hypothetical protein
MAAGLNTSAFCHRTVSFFIGHRKVKFESALTIGFSAGLVNVWKAMVGN